MPVDGTSFEGEIDTIRFELIDEGLELPEEVVNDSVLAGGESAASTVGDVHEVDAEDGHGTIISRCVSTIHTAELEVYLLLREAAFATFSRATDACVSAFSYA